MKLACLIGNGLSIAYNPDLSTPALTESLISEFRNLGGNQAAVSLSAFARSLNPGEARSFEDLLAPLETASEALPSLAGLLSLSRIATGDLRISITRTAQFLNEIHRLGLGTALRLIERHAQGAGGGQFDRTVLATCRAIATCGAEGPIAVATLNYDGLLHAGFKRLHDDDDVPMCDLAEGFSVTTYRATRQNELACWKLRTRKNLMDTRIQLLNLHGSLGWLSNMAGDSVFKFEFDELRRIRYWDKLAAGDARLVPCVVLTNRKTQLIREWPFALAYEIFEESLVEADHWLIAGYSFLDKPLNRVLKRALRRRPRGQTKVLAVNKGPYPQAARNAFLGDVGVDCLYVSNLGLPGALNGARWQAWINDVC